MSPKFSRKRNVQTGVTIGLFGATLLAAWALLAYSMGSQTLPRSGASLSRILLAYYAAGILGGAIVGLLLGYTQNLVGKVVVGAVAGAIFYLSIQIALKGPIWQWDNRSLLQTTILGLVIGGISGPWIAYRLRSPS
jgi:hypothetical protein